MSNVARGSHGALGNGGVTVLLFAFTFGVCVLQIVFGAAFLITLRRAWYGVNEWYVPAAWFVGILLVGLLISLLHLMDARGLPDSQETS